MSCSKCGKGSGLCPVSLGLALGITSVLGMVVWTAVGLYEGVEGITLNATLIYFLIVFIKSFVFGFVLALIYSLINRCCRRMCGKSKSGEGCDCNSK